MNLLDTDAVVELLRRKRYEAGAISIITLIEVLRGVKPEKRGEVKSLLEESFDVLTLNNKVIETYCRLYQDLKRRGILIPDADLLIAATAMAHNLRLKSGDQHFKRLVGLGLKLESEKKRK